MKITGGDCIIRSIDISADQGTFSLCHRPKNGGTMTTRIILLLAILWLTACTSQPVQQQELPLLPNTEKSSVATIIPSTPEISKDAIIEVVVGDLSKRLSIKPETIRVLGSESALWSDSALGCPLQGETYAQGTVPGYMVRLDASGQVYEYHTDQTGGNLVLCQAEGPDEITVPTLPVKPGSDKDTIPWVPVN